MDLKEEQLLSAPPVNRMRRNTLLTFDDEDIDDCESVLSASLKEANRNSKPILQTDLSNALFKLMDNMQEKSDHSSSFILTSPRIHPPQEGIPKKPTSTVKCRKGWFPKIPSRSASIKGSSKNLSKSPSTFPRRTSLTTNSLQLETFPMMPLKQTSKSMTLLGTKNSTTSEETIGEQKARWRDTDSLSGVPERSTSTYIGSLPTITYSIEGEHEDHVEDKNSNSKIRLETLSTTSSSFPRRSSITTSSSQSVTLPKIPLKQTSNSMIRLGAKKSTTSEETIGNQTARLSDTDSLAGVPESSTSTYIGSLPTIAYSMNSILEQQVEGEHEEGIIGDQTISIMKKRKGLSDSLSGSTTSTNICMFTTIQNPRRESLQNFYATSRLINEQVSHIARPRRMSKEHRWLTLVFKQ
jgi:hypothetical protein